MAIDNQASQRGQRKGSQLDSSGESEQSRGESADNSGGTIVDGEVNSKNNKTDSNEKRGQKAVSTTERANDERWEGDSSGVVDAGARETQSISNRSDIRVFEEGLSSASNAHSNGSERDRREAESQRLVAVAKKNNLFISDNETTQLGEKNLKRTGESVVYINREKGRVYKVKNPYAKAALKKGVGAEDVIYEHHVHNLLFPETQYTFEGISEDMGDV